MGASDEDDLAVIVSAHRDRRMQPNLLHGIGECLNRVAVNGPAAFGNDDTIDGDGFGIEHLVLPCC